MKTDILRTWKQLECKEKPLYPSTGKEREPGAGGRVALSLSPDEGCPLQDGGLR